MPMMDADIAVGKLGAAAYYVTRGKYPEERAFFNLEWAAFLG